MHFISSNLYLQWFAFERYHCGVKRLIHIPFGVSNEIIELSAQWMPEAMNDAQGVITIGDFVNKDANRQEIVNLTEFLSLLGIFLHLGINAVDALWPAADISLESCFLKLIFQNSAGIGDVSVPGCFPDLQKVGDLPVIIRLKPAK